MDLAGPNVLGGGHFAPGDPVVVSSHDGHFGLAIGFVREVGPAWIVLGLDRDLLGPPQRSASWAPTTGPVGGARQWFDGLWEGTTTATGPAAPDVENAPLPARPMDRSARLAAAIFRVDKDELTAGLGTVRANLMQLFTTSGDAKRRRLIVDGQGAVRDKRPLPPPPPPRGNLFGPSPLTVEMAGAHGRPPRAAPRFRPEATQRLAPALEASLNEDQRMALDRVMRGTKCGKGDGSAAAERRRG